MSNIVTVNNTGENISITVPAPVRSSEVSVTQETVSTVELTGLVVSGITSIVGVAPVTADLAGTTYTISVGTITDQYIPKFSTSDGEFVDSTAFATSNGVTFSGSSAETTPAVKIKHTGFVSVEGPEDVYSSGTDIDISGGNGGPRGDFYIEGGSWDGEDFIYGTANDGIIRYNKSTDDTTQLSQDNGHWFVKYFSIEDNGTTHHHVVSLNSSMELTLYAYDKSGNTLTDLQTYTASNDFQTKFDGATLENTDVFLDGDNNIFVGTTHKTSAGGLTMYGAMFVFYVYYNTVVNEPRLSERTDHYWTHVPTQGSAEYEMIDFLGIGPTTDATHSKAMHFSVRAQGIHSIYKFPFTSTSEGYDSTWSAPSSPSLARKYKTDSLNSAFSDPDYQSLYLSYDPDSDSIWNRAKSGHIYRIDTVDGFAATKETTTALTNKTNPGAWYDGTGGLYSTSQDKLYVEDFYVEDGVQYLTAVYDTTGGELTFEKRLTDAIVSTGYESHIYHSSIESSSGDILNPYTGAAGADSAADNTSLDAAYIDISNTPPAGVSDLTFSEGTLKSQVEFTYGSYTQNENDSPVDPIAFLGLNVDGLIYAAKSPDSDSHHFYTNEFDSGNYIKILTINEEGLIVYKDDGTSDAVTKDKIGNWNYAYNNTIEDLEFDAQTAIITATQVDGGTLTVDISALYDDTDTTYDISTSDNDTDGVDVNLNGSDETTDTITLVGTNDVTITQAASVITIDAPHETTTSISFANNTITYTDEDAATTDIDLSAYDVDYSLGLGTLGSNEIPIELTDTNGVVTDVSILGSDNITITNPSSGVIAIASSHTTYDLAASDNATDGVDVTLSGSDSTDDVITIVGANDVTVTQTSGTITIDAPHETTTSLSFNATNARLTYTDEDGTDNIVSLSSLVETVTSISLANDTITYTDEDGVDTDLDLTPYLDNTDTTYSVSTTNAVSGANIVLTAGGSGSGTDSVSIVGGDNVTVTQANDVITVAAADETVTSISLSANILTYTDESGTDTDIDLSLYLDDTNLARLTSGTLDGSTGEATFTRDDGTTFTVDFSDLLDDTDSTYDLNVSTNTSSGVDVNLVAGGASTGTDTVVFRGANGVDVTQSAGVVTIDGTSLANSNDYVDSLSWDATTETLTVGRTGSLTDLTVSMPDTDDLQDVCGRGNETDTNIIITDSSYLEFQPLSGSNSSLQPSGSDFTVSAGGSLILRSAGSTTKQIVIGANNTYYSNGGSHNFYGGVSSSIAGSTVRCGTLIVSGSASFQSFSTTSSIRFKENIRPLEYNKEALLSLEPVRYDWKEDGKKDDVGLIAEDVLNHIPEVVAVSEDGVVDGIDYSRLSVFLLQMVKEQEERINKLEELINNSK